MHVRRSGDRDGDHGQGGAMVLIAWPRTAVSRKRRTSSARGQASWTMRTSPSAKWPAAPFSVIAAPGRRILGPGGGCAAHARARACTRVHAQGSLLDQSQPDEVAEVVSGGSVLVVRLHTQRVQ